jgi:hypothetical protein
MLWCMHLVGNAHARSLGSEPREEPLQRPLPHLVDLRTKQYIDRLREL